MSETTTRVPALDGLRAIAVAAVLAFHGGVPGMSGGFLGVEVFFVLSGYLITSILVTEVQRTGRIGLVGFWGRRARRLLPALVVMITVVALLAPRFLPPVEVWMLRDDGLATLFYTANWRMIWQGEDYFSQTAAPSPLEHTWSLGIEEQFYLLWPVVLVAVLTARGSLRALLAVCLGGFALSTVALAALHHAVDPSRSYYGTDTRAAALLLGAALATWLSMRGADELTPRRRRCLSTLTAVALGGLAYALTQASGGSPLLYRGGLAAVAAAVVVVLAHVALVPRGAPARVLSLAPLVGLGLISYGVYLWHWPVFLAATAGRTGHDGWTLFAIRVTATVAVATASYALVERPIRRGVRWRRPQVALPVGLAAVAGAASVVLAATAVPAATQAQIEAPQRDGLDQVTAPVREAESGPPSRGRSAAAPARRVRPGERVIVDVFGDSVAWSLVAYLPEHPDLDVRDRTSLGCGITTTAPYRYFGQVYRGVMPKCRAWEQRWRRAVTADDPHVALVLVGRWETMDRVLDGRWVHLGNPAYDEHLRRRLARSVEIAGARGAQVLLATEPYNRRGEQLDGSLFPEDLPERVTRWNAIVQEVAAAHPRVGVLHFGARVSPEGRYTSTAGGVQIRADGLHLAPEGVQRWIAPWLFIRLLRAAPR